MANLNQQQEIFCREYMIDSNATAAYIRAGYKARGKSAEVGAAQLLRNTKVQARLQELKAEKSSRLNNLGDRVIAELEKIAFARLADAVEWVDAVDEEPGRYRIKTLDEIPMELKPAIIEIRVSRLGQSIKLADKIRALEAIAKIMGMMSDLNMAIATLRRYGINLIAENGEWKVIDDQLEQLSINAGELEGSNETED